MICPKCSFQNKPDARFCAECGFRFVVQTISVDTSAMVQPLPVDSAPTPQSPSIDISNIKIPPRFFHFLKPYLNYIDKGSIFRRPFFWLYVAFSIICLLTPLYGLYQIIDKEMMKYTNSLLVVLGWLLIAFTYWLGFQMWWDRKEKVQSVTRQGDEFVAIPVFSYFIQHLGEWLSLTIGLLGFGGSFLGILFSESINQYTYYFNVEREMTGYLWKAPLAGFAVLILTRVIAEILRALTSIANNTKKS